jgi:hypothetical protein
MRMTTHQPAEQGDATTVTRLLSTKGAVLATGAASAIAKVAASTEAAARAALAEHYDLDEGDGITIRHPDTRAKLGKVTRSDPKPVAEVFSESALLEHGTKENPDGVASLFTVTGDPDDVVAVLLKHAPQLVTESTELRDWYRKELLASAVAGEAIPGVAVRTKPGVVSVTHAEGSLDQYRALMAAGQLDPLAPLTTELPASDAA